MWSTVWGIRSSMEMKEELVGLQPHLKHHKGLWWAVIFISLAKRVGAPGGRSPTNRNTVVADFPTHPPTLSNGMGDDQSTDIKLPYPRVSGSLALHSGFYLSRYCISGLYKVKSSHSTPGQQCFPEYAMWSTVNCLARSLEFITNTINHSHQNINLPMSEFL